MNFKISYVSERDIDLLFVQEISSSKEFLSFVVDKLRLNPVKSVLSISHSLMHPTLGESDIVVVLEIENYKHAIFFENKIDALAMKNQFDRYELRAEEGIQKGEYDKYSILMLAPKRYLDSNLEASKYPNKISYEEILEFIEKNETHAKAYKAHLVQMAIDKEKVGYVPQADEKVTLFWNKYYSYKNQHFPHLILNEVEGPRGSKARWPWFGTLHKAMAIAHKSNRGYVDLTLHGQANELIILEEKLNHLLETNMSLVRTKKSTSIRITVPKIDFEEEFEMQINQVKLALEAVDKMFKLSKLILISDYLR